MDNLKRCQNARNLQISKKIERIETEGQQLSSVIKKLSENKDDADKESKRKNMRRKPNVNEDQQIKKAGMMCSESNCSDMRQKFANAKEHEECFLEINRLMLGAYCVVLGADAALHTSVDTSNKITSVKIVENDAVNLFEKCYDYFNLSCAMTNVYAFAEQSGESMQEPHPRKGKNQKIYDVCQRVAELDTCKDDKTKCEIGIKTAFMEAFVSIGSGCAFGDSDSDFEQGSKNLSYLEGVIKEDQGTSESTARLLSGEGRVLEEEVSAECGLQVVANGVEILKIADNSKIDFSEYLAFVGVLQTLSLGLLFWLFA
jgi:hypothetical protein